MNPRSTVRRDQVPANRRSRFLATSAALGTSLLLSTVASAQTPVYVRARFIGSSIEQTLELYKHSVRGPNYHVVQTTLAGEVPVEAGAVRTYRGTVCGYPGSRAFARKRSSGTYDVIAVWTGYSGMTGTGSEVGSCGMAAAEAVPGQAEFSQNFACGVSTEVPTLPCEPELRYVEIGADMDSAHISILLADVGNGDLCDAISEIEHEINAANYYYERDAGLAHVVGRIVLRTPESDPYPLDQRNAYAWLSALRSEWVETSQEHGLAAALIFAYRPHNTANAAYHNSICNPNFCYGVISRGNTYQRRVTGVAHIMGLIWGGRICGYSGFQTVCDQPPYDCDNCMVLFFNSPNGDCNFGYRLGQCQIDLLQPKLDNACVFDAADVGRTAHVTANGMQVDDGDTVQMTSSPVIVGTPAQASLVYTNQSLCPVTMDVELTAGSGADWQVLDCSTCPVVVAPGASRAFRVTVNSIWPATFNAALSIRVAGPIRERVFRLNLVYQTTTPVGVIPGEFALQAPQDGATIVQDRDTCIGFEWGHAQYVDHYELVLLRKHETATGSPGFQIVLNEEIRFADGFEQPTCALPPANDSPLDYIWVVRAVNDYGDRIVTYHPYEDHFPLGFGLYEPFIPSLSVTIPPGGSNCPPSSQSECTSEVTAGRRVTSYGNINLDKCVDADDLAILQGNLGQNHLTSYRDGDLDFDGDVDQNDLDIFMTIGLDCACHEFSGCGWVQEVTQGGCIHFRADCGEMLTVRNIGNFQIGDFIWVRGALDDNDAFCFPAPPYPSIPDNEFGKCISLIGTIVNLGGCILLNEENRYYELENLGTHQPGDVVFVVGGIVEGTTPECPLELPITVISGNTIRYVVR